MKTKNIFVWIGITILLVLFTTSCVPCPECVETVCPECTECPECEECDPTCADRCLSFEDFLVGTNFLNEFQLDDFGFESIDGKDLDVLEIDGLRSLRLWTAGIRIFLPCPASEVIITLGSWAGGPIKVDARNSAKDQVDLESVPGDNSFHTVTLSGSDITTILISEVGDNEGALAKICVVFE